jgi:hypothetical protein
MLMKKILTTLQKIINKKIKKVKAREFLGDLNLLSVLFFWVIWPPHPVRPTPHSVLSRSRLGP